MTLTLIVISYICYLFLSSYVVLSSAVGLAIVYYLGNGDVMDDLLNVSLSVVGMVDDYH